MSSMKLLLADADITTVQRLWTYLLIAGLVLVAAKVVESLRAKSKCNFPNPAGGGLPWIGNAFEIPTTPKQRLEYMTALAKKHGEMYTLHIAGVNWVFLNSQRVVNDLLDKRAATFSGRRPTPLSDLATRGLRMLTMPWGDLWKRERKIMHQILNQSQHKLFAPWQDQESKALLRNYLDAPDKWYKAHGVYAGSVISSVVFGRRPAFDDENLAASLQATDEYLTMLAPSSAIGNMFPFLLKIPYLTSLQPWRWAADELYYRTRGIYKTEVDGVRERTRSSEQKPCFMSEFFDSKEDQNFTEDQILFLAGTLLEAGTDTTRMSLNQIVVAATLFPDWPAKARKELDALCGSSAERLPGTEDIDRLPYIKAVTKEAFRWKPSIADTGSPHCATEDYEYEGYRLPAGTIVTINHWVIANDPNEYEEPERFWPDRFLNENLDKRLNGHLGFGAGRRVCVGYNVGTSNMHIAVARLLYCFDFVAIGPIDMSGPLSIEPQHSPADIKVSVRSEAHQKLIESTCIGTM